MKEFTLPSLFNDEPEEIVQSVKIEEKPVVKKAEKRIVSLTSLEKKFSKIVAASGQNHLNVFTEWLDYIIEWFTPFGDMSKFDERIGLLQELTHDYFCLMEDMLSKQKWYDAWGDLFQLLMGNFTGYRGQFFTPEALVDITTERMNIDDINPSSCGAFGDRIKVSDSACGSARFLLSAHSYLLLKDKPQPYLIGEDLDHICVKMAAVNMCVHGCFGEVICHDSLLQDQGKLWGYKINEGRYPFPGLPTIRRFESASAFILFS